MNEEIELMIGDCIKRESKMTDWERKFIASISIQYFDSFVLTDNQISKLNSIWEKVT